MFCTKCGQQIQDGAQVCIYCGAPVEGYSTPKQVYKQKSKVGGVLGTIFGVIAAIALVAVVVGSSMNAQSGQQKPERLDATVSDPETEPSKPEDTQINPTEPTVSTEPTEPTEPAVSTEPTEPTVSTEPTEPIEPTDPPEEPEEPEPSEPPEDLGVPCTKLETTTQLILSEKGRPLQLGVSVEPLDTTDPITFVSSDPSVVTVDAVGKVTAVGNGKATITITCGKQVKTCKITCILEEDVEIPVEPDDPEVPELKLRSASITIMIKGYVWDAYDGEIDRSQIIWTSSNESVCTVLDGKVTCVAPGTATIRAEYQGQVATCKITCNWTE